VDVADYSYDYTIASGDFSNVTLPSEQLRVRLSASVAGISDDTDGLFTITTGSVATLSVTPSGLSHTVAYGKGDTIIDTVTLTFDSNALSADYGANAWLNAKIRFVGGGDVLLAYANTPQDVKPAFTGRLNCPRSNQSGCSLAICDRGSMI